MSSAFRYRVLSGHGRIHEGAERQKLFDGICKQHAIYREYQAQTERPIPIIELNRHH